MRRAWRQAPHRPDPEPRLPVPAGIASSAAALSGSRSPDARTCRYAWANSPTGNPSGVTSSGPGRTSRSTRPPAFANQIPASKNRSTSSQIPSVWRRFTSSAKHQIQSSSSLGVADDLVAVGAEVAAGVAVGALVAAAGLAADQALPEVLPPAALLDARRTDVERGVNLRDADRVVTGRNHQAHRTITGYGASNDGPARPTRRGGGRPTHRRRRRDAPAPDRDPGRWAGEPPLAGAACRGRHDPRRRGDGHDAVRERGLQFGDPPEVWNIAHPDVVRRIHRGYLEAGSRIVLTNTFGGNRLRLRLHGHDGASTSSTGPRRSCSARRSTRPAAGARRRRHRAVRRDHGAARDARLRRGGRRLRRAGRGAGRRRRRPAVDRDDVGPLGDRGGDRGRRRGAGHAGGRDDDVRHPRPDDDGRHARRPR